MALIVDAHADLAWNMLTFGRDYTRSVSETRRLESGSIAVEKNGNTLLGWPEYQCGQTAVVFSTLYAAPIRHRSGDWEKLVYSNYNEAHRLYRDQALLYHKISDSIPDKFRLLFSKSDLELLLDHWANPSPDGHPVGMVILMEGAEGIRDPHELAEWYELGVRLIGLAWVGTRYSGGWKEPGSLTKEGRQLLNAMSDYNFILDLSHMDEAAALEALDIYGGPIVATHGNCLSLLPGYASNRQFSDRVIRGVIERDGVVGVVPFNNFLKVGWIRENGRREEVSLDDVAAHIDHICQLAGDSRHAGIGSDFDGGFGLESTPAEINDISDLQKLDLFLSKRGYTESDIASILGGNWLNRLSRDLPSR